MTTPKTRTERDTFGPIEVAADRLWGAQTQRSLTNFKISGERMPAALLHALATVKKAAALVNMDLAALDEKKGRAIVAAADEVLAGKHDGEFPLVVWQTGSGTQTNMNMNEVLANRASEILGGERGEGRLVHPNDHVNKGQSSNDVFPTAMHVAAVAALREHVIPSVARLRDVLRGEGRGLRRHREDRPDAPAGRDAAHPRAGVLGLGVPSSTTASPTSRRRSRISASWPWAARRSAPASTRIPSTRCAWRPSSPELTGHPFVTAPNKFEALAANDALVHAHGALKTLAASLTKIANDVRWLASGPRCGIGEIADPGERARELDHARQGEPDPVRGHDDGRGPGHGQRRGDQHRRRLGQLRAQRLQAADHPQLPQQRAG